MKGLVLLIIGIATYQFSVAQSTWFTGHNMPQFQNFRVGGAAREVDEPKNRVLCMWNTGFTGNSSSRFAYYNASSGALLKHFDLVKGSYLYEIAERFIQFNDNLFLIGGGAVNSNSNANYTNHTMLSDSNGTLLFFRHLTEQLKHETKTSDTSFLAIEGTHITYLTHFNTKGDTIWQMPFAHLLDIATLDSNYKFQLQKLECVENECHTWLTHKSIEEQIIIHFNPSNGQVNSRDTLQINGFVKGNRVKTKGWDGYVIVAGDSINTRTISLLDLMFNKDWGIQYYEDLGVDLRYAFVNNDSNLVYSVWHTSPYKSTTINYSSHTYSRVYTVNKIGVVNSAVQYFDTIREYRCSPVHQFEDGGYLMNIQSYYHIAESFGSLIARSKPDGTIIDTNSWAGKGPFKDVSLFDPFEQKDSVNISVLESNLGNCELSIYPNPSHSSLTISIEASNKIEYSLQNLNGQVISSDSFEKETVLDVSNLSSGLYFLQIQGEGILETRKIIVSH
ncbi:MAG: T9SS type A sorting domain-containing protein [Salibacteraceae bacterium]